MEPKKRKKKSTFPSRHQHWLRNHKREGLLLAHKRNLLLLLVLHFNLSDTLNSSSSLPVREIFPLSEYYQHPQHSINEAARRRKESRRTRGGGGGEDEKDNNNNIYTALTNRGMWSLSCAFPPPHTATCTAES